MHTNVHQFYHEIIFQQSSGTCLSPCSCDFFICFSACFCSGNIPLQLVPFPLGHGGRASPWAAPSPVLAAPAGGWNGSAPWLESHLKSLKNLGNNQWNHKIWKPLEQIMYIVHYIVVFEPLILGFSCYSKVVCENDIGRIKGVATGSLWKPGILKCQ